MDLENEKPSYVKPLPHSFVMENDHDGKGECSSRFKNNAHDSVDHIIEKYKVERLTKKFNNYSNQYLCRSNGEHALFHANADKKHSIQNFNNYIEPKYITVRSNKNKHVSRINSDIPKPNREFNENLIPKVTASRADHENMKFYKQTGFTSTEKLYADKTTYCRPVVNLYNKEYIYKTMEKNSKLKQLVKNLAIARKREKEIVTWNNFINELKNKHYPSSNERTHLPQLGSKQYFTSDIIDDYNNRRTWQQSTPCTHLLQDFYEGHYHPSRSLDVDQKSSGNKIQPESNHYSLPYNTDSFCYPTSSQGRLIMLERERRKNEDQRHYHLPNFQYENNHGFKKYPESILGRKKNSRNLYSFNNNKSVSKTFIENASIQTNQYVNENICENKATNKTECLLINELIQTFESDKKIEEDHLDTGHDIRDISLVNIANKIETLISCVNNFINELKLHKKFKSKKSKAASVTCEMNNDTNENINITKSDIIDKVGAARRDLVFGEIFNETSESTLPYSNFYPCTKPSEIDGILTGIDKFCSKDNMPLKNQHCSVNIIFEVPTKDCSTEVTKSLSKQHSGAKVDIVEEISTSVPTPMQQMTIAVNTDPFNFLTLLRISTEAVMRLLSNMPNINYHTYLGLLPFPHITRKVESNYICNICGAAFNKPSALSDHIQEHNLGKTRDCCVCRHVLDMSRTPPKLFKCQFCGQRFTRAYCCQLHQQRCAQQLGLMPDVASSLMLLR